MCASARPPTHPDMQAQPAPPELLLLLRGQHSLHAPHLHSLLAQLRAQQAMCKSIVSAH